mmetsp:Transcript_62170/g.183808  ORF Transcript_62170/g.183808 Transcript_62170/m.183808 type:complete len:147 (-) Transcript_62170:2126-2566(-)
MTTCRRIVVTNEEEWRPYSVDWAENERPFEDMAPSVWPEDLQGTKVSQLSVREVNNVKGEFRGFKRIITSVATMSVVWMAAKRTTLASEMPASASVAGERFGVEIDAPSHGYRNICVVRVEGRYAIILEQLQLREAKATGRTIAFY